VRKTTSRIGARLEPMNHVEVQLYRGRELDTVQQVDLVVAPVAIRSDLGRVGQALSMLEAADHLLIDREPNEALYSMLVRALEELAARPSPVVFAAFCFKALSLEGVGPVVDVCASCGSPDVVAFDLDAGGTTCRGCRTGQAVGPEVLRVLRDVLGGHLVRALAEPESPATAGLSALAARTMEQHLERRLRSVAVLEPRDERAL
jgi:DNA repair protein RecO (recombination protein O)